MVVYERSAFISKGLRVHDLTGEEVHSGSLRSLAKDSRLLRDPHFRLVDSEGALLIVELLHTIISLPSLPLLNSLLVHSIDEVISRIHKGLVHESLMVARLSALTIPLQDLASQLLPLELALATLHTVFDTCTQPVEADDMDGAIILLLRVLGLRFENLLDEWTLLSPGVFVHDDMSGLLGQILLKGDMAAGALDPGLDFLRRPTRNVACWRESNDVAIFETAWGHLECCWGWWLLLMVDG